MHEYLRMYVLDYMMHRARMGLPLLVKFGCALHTNTQTTPLCFIHLVNLRYGVKLDNCYLVCSELSHSY